MRNIRYKSIAVVLSCVLIVALTACGTETSQRSGDGTDPKIKIRIAWWGGQSRHDYTKKLLELYTESHPHIEFETIPVEWDGYFDKLSTLAASGAMPDLVQMDYQYIDTYTDNGSLTDLQEYVDDGTIRVGDIEEDLLDAGKVKGRMTGVVITSSTLCVGYNAEVLEKNGDRVAGRGLDMAGFYRIRFKNQPDHRKRKRHDSGRYYKRYQYFPLLGATAGKRAVQ